MSKLQMLDTANPRGLKVLDTANPRGLKMVDTLKRNYPATDTKRHTKADNGRLLPLGSAAWRKLRRSVLAGEPLCRHCTARGLTVVAQDVDHRDNDPSNNDICNLVPLCHSCHSRKTARDMGGNVRMGCDASGNPMDATHHWNKPSLSRPSGPAVDDVQKSPATDGCTPTSKTCFIPNCENVA